MYIKKKEQEKNAIRINSEKDIPYFLQKTIQIKNNEVEFHNAEGIGHAPLGMVFGFEKLENSETGYGAWNINDLSRIKEVDGKFYSVPVVTEACSIPKNETIPELVKNCDVKRNEDGSWSIKTKWGVSTGKPNEALFVKYGTNKDGTIDANILTISTPSFKEYELCTKDGTIIRNSSILKELGKDK